MYPQTQYWHGLSRRARAGAAPLAKLRAALLNWEMATVALYVKRAHQALPYSGVAMVRTEQKRCFGYASARHTSLLQTQQTVEFIPEFCGAGKLALETVGAVGSEQYVWALARVRGESIAIDNDLIEGYLLIANSQGPDRRLILENTQGWVVCNNFLTLALADGA